MKRQFYPRAAKGDLQSIIRPNLRKESPAVFLFFLFFFFAGVSPVWLYNNLTLSASFFFFHGDMLRALMDGWYVWMTVSIYWRRRTQTQVLSGQDSDPWPCDPASHAHNFRSVHNELCHAHSQPLSPGHSQTHTHTQKLVCADQSSRLCCFYNWEQLW